MSEGRQPLEIEVIEWEENSFTIEAGINPQFEQQLTHGIVPFLILRHNGRQIQQLRDVRVRVKSTDFQRSMVESHLEEENDLADFTRQVMVSEYEEVR
jgi:hypothetical protein